MSPNTGRTPLTRRNRIECRECDEVIDGDFELKRTVHWGEWDVETQTYDRHTRQEHYCSACWREHFEREAAAYYDVEDAERLWDILAASDGRLVADLKHIFVGGRPWIRVVDGELQAMGSTREAREEGGETVVSFGVEKVDVDREWYEETFMADRELPDEDYPTLAMLKPAEETPFQEWADLPDDQSTLDDHDGGDDDGE